MKKLGLSLFVIVMLLGLACCGSKKEEETIGETKQTEAQIEWVENSVMVVNISVNPEIELYLDEMGKVLEAKALNSDAQKVLQGLDFTDAGYDVGVQMILLSLKDHGYAGNGQEVKVTPYVKAGHALDTVQVVNDINVAIAQIEKDLQVSFGCKVADVQVAGGTVATDPNSTAAPYNTTAPSNSQAAEEDVFDEVERDAAGNVIRTVMTMDNGAKVESFYDGNGQVTREHIENLDGRIEENFYQNGVLARTTATDLSGMASEMIYDANGLLQQETYKQADGRMQEYTYQNNQLVREYRIEADGSNWEHFYENDLRVKEFSKDAGGNTNEVTYQIVGGQSLRLKEVMVWGGVTTTTDFSYDSAGELTQMRHTDSNGDWSNEYFQKGVLYKAERSWGSSFITYTYDANGCLVSGSGSSDTQILEEIYYPGINRVQVRTIKHLYDTFNTTKEYFDQNENLLRIEVYDPNGTLIKTNYP